MKNLSDFHWTLAKDTMVEFESCQVMNLHDQAIASGCAEMVQLLGEGDLHTYHHVETVQMMAVQVM